MVRAQHRRSMSACLSSFFHGRVFCGMLKRCFRAGFKCMSVCIQSFCDESMNEPSYSQTIGSSVFCAAATSDASS